VYNACSLTIHIIGDQALSLAIEEENHIAIRMDPNHVVIALPKPRLPTRFQRPGAVLQAPPLAAAAFLESVDRQFTSVAAGRAGVHVEQSVLRLTDDAARSR
jgi:hypothetical protein